MHDVCKSFLVSSGHTFQGSQDSDQFLLKLVQICDKRFLEREKDPYEKSPEILVSCHGSQECSRWATKVFGSSHCWRLERTK